MREIKKESNTLNPLWHCLYPQTDKASTQAASVLCLDNRGLAYGDGFFTTMGVLEGKVLWQDYHLQRLHTHAQALQLNLRTLDLVPDLQAQAEQLQQGIMKLIVTRAPETVRGYGFTPSASGSDCQIWLKSTPTSIDTSQRLHLNDTSSILLQPAIKAICLTSKLSSLPPPLAGLKTLNRLDSVLASGELQSAKARSSNIDEGLVRDMSGDWIEGTMSNVFYQLSGLSKPSIDASSSPITNYATTNNGDNLAANYLLSGQLSGQWFTPPIVESGVAGVMRQVIIDALADTDQPVSIRPLSDDDLPNITQLFFCNALRGVVPVSSLTLLNGEVVGFD